MEELQMALTVTKSDLKKIGHTIFSDDGNLVIICDINTANIEEILLRNILKCYGEEYKIVDTDDYFSGGGNDGIIYKTNLPYELYK